MAEPGKDVGVGYLILVAVTGTGAIVATVLLHQFDFTAALAIGLSIAGVGLFRRRRKV